MASKFKKSINDIILSWMVRDKILLCQESINDLTDNIDLLTSMDSVTKDKLEERINNWGIVRELIIGSLSVSDLADELFKLIFDKINKEGK